MFSLNSEENTRNVRKYAEHGNGHREFLQGAKKLMVWVGLTRTGVVLGPHFAERNLDTREHLRIIRYNVVQRDFRIHNVDRNVMWWQQDGAPSHTGSATIRYLRGQFPDRLMSKRGDWPWPPRSPDLTVCDFCLWGYLKHQIWNVPTQQKPSNLGELRQAIIIKACKNLEQDMIEKAFSTVCFPARDVVFRLMDMHFLMNEN